MENKDVEVKKETNEEVEIAAKTPPPHEDESADLAQNVSTSDDASGAIENEVVQAQDREEADGGAAEGVDAPIVLEEDDVPAQEGAQNNGGEGGGAPVENGAPVESDAEDDDIQYIGFKLKDPKEKKIEDLEKTVGQMQKTITQLQTNVNTLVLQNSFTMRVLSLAHGPLLQQVSIPHQAAAVAPNRNDDQRQAAGNQEEEGDAEMPEAEGGEEEEEVEEHPNQEGSAAKKPRIE